MRRSRLRISGVLAAVVLLVTACSGDDGGSETLPTDITDATTTTTTTSAPPTTLPASTTTTTTMAPTTPPPSTTVATTQAPSAVETLVPTDPGDTGAVGEQYLASRERERELLMNPTLDDLEARVATFAKPGSPYYDEMLAAIRDQVAQGERFAPSDPSIDFATVEAVSFEGDPPYTRAILQTCDVSNDLVVFIADGETIANPAFDGSFNTYRHRFSVELTDQGWVRESLSLEVLGDYKGQPTCPAP